MNQPVAEGDDAVRKVVLREPGDHTLLLHVGTTRYVYDQIAQILPVSAENKGSTALVQAEQCFTIAGSFTPVLTPADW